MITIEQLEEIVRESRGMIEFYQGRGAKAEFLDDTQEVKRCLKCITRETVDLDKAQDELDRRAGEE